VFLDIMHSFNGYQACYHRTFSCGKPTDAQVEAYNTAWNWLESSIEAVEPGVTTAEVADQGYEPAVGQFPFQASGRALTSDDADGFVELIFDDDSGILFGAHVVGPEASELIATLSVAVSAYMTASDIAESIAVHPTLSEAVIEAAQQALGSAVHTHNRPANPVTGWVPVFPQVAQ